MEWVGLSGAPLPFPPARKANVGAWLWLHLWNIQEQTWVAAGADPAVGWRDGSINGYPTSHGSPWGEIRAGEAPVPPSSPQFPRAAPSRPQLLFLAAVRVRRKE